MSAIGRVDRRVTGLSFGFTLVEMIVVISIILIILLIAVPGLSSLTREAKFNSGIQQANSALTRAYFQSLADSNLVAVRVMPGAWDDADDGAVDEGRNRQHLVTYSYRRPQLTGGGLNEEHFGRAESVAPVVLPSDVWAAPAEAVAGGALGDRFLAEGYLDGTVGAFTVLGGNENPRASTGLLESDDFLIVFDPQTGLRISREIQDFSLWAADRTPGNTAQFTRIYRPHFSGLTFYRRAAFEALGQAADGRVRQDWLKNFSRPTFVHRKSGGLVEGVLDPLQP